MLLSKQARESAGFLDEVRHCLRVLAQTIKISGNIMTNILTARVEGTF
jgi:hypothetical protein